MKGGKRVKTTPLEAIVQTSNPATGWRPSRHRLELPTERLLLGTILKSNIMRNILSIIALALCFTINAQTKVGFGGGMLEQSNKFGLGIASTISVEQDVVGNFGLAATYNYSALRGNNFQQLYLAPYYEYHMGRLSLKPSIGAARQISGDILPAFGFDMLVKASDRTQIVLGWQPTIRGHFRDAQTGWSLITTMGVLVRL